MSLRDRLATRWRRLPLAFLLGGLGTLIFAPFHVFPVGIVAFGGLLILLDASNRKAEAFWTGWAFGWGHFVAGLYWIASAFLVEPEKFAWMIPFPTLGLPALLALFPGVAAVLAWRLSDPGPRRVLALAAAWTLMEMARGWVLTGFPWNLVGYAFGVHHLAMQPAAWIGIFGLSFMAMLIFCAPALLLTRTGSRRSVVMLFGLPVLLIGLAVPRALTDEAGDGQSMTVRIVQANIAQRDKWRPDRIEANFERLVALSLQPTETPVDIVIWPETAATYFLSQRADKRLRLGQIAAATTSGVMITGAPRLEAGRVYNSALVIGESGQIQSAANKHHLVPFGEYLPLRPLLQALNIEQLAHGRGDFARGHDQEVLQPGNLPAAAILVCYEAIFPARAHRADRPGWLLNLTNDGWFGTLTGPDQHFDMARFRAVEQGLPLVRAAGTGISATVDRHGRVRNRLPLGEAGVLDGTIVTGGTPTPFSLGGNWIVLISVILLMVVMSRFSQRSRA